MTLVVGLTHHGDLELGGFVGLDSRSTFVLGTIRQPPHDAVFARSERERRTGPRTLDVHVTPRYRLEWLALRVLIGALFDVSKPTPGFIAM
mgnify:CR=1 FL=1